MTVSVGEAWSRNCGGDLVWVRKVCGRFAVGEGGLWGVCCGCVRFGRFAVGVGGLWEVWCGCGIFVRVPLLGEGGLVRECLVWFVSPWCG